MSNENVTHSVYISTHSDLMLPLILEEQAKDPQEPFSGKSGPMMKNAISQAHRTIGHLYPELQEIYQPRSVVYGQSGLEYVGSKEIVEAAAQSLAFVVHSETRHRLYQITVKKLGTDCEDYRNERDFVLDHHLLVA